MKSVPERWPGSLWRLGRRLIYRLSGFPAYKSVLYSLTKQAAACEPSNGKALSMAPDAVRDNFWVLWLGSFHWLVAQRSLTTWYVSILSILYFLLRIPVCLCPFLHFTLYSNRILPVYEGRGYQIGDYSLCFHVHYQSRDEVTCRDGTVRSYSLLPFKLYVAAG